MSKPFEPEKIISEETLKEIAEEQERYAKLQASIDLATSHAILNELSDKQLSDALDIILNDFQYRQIGNNELKKYEQHLRDITSKAPTQGVAFSYNPKPSTFRDEVKLKMKQLKGTALKTKKEYDSLRYTISDQLRRDLATNLIPDEVQKIVGDRLIQDPYVSYVTKTNGAKERIQYWYDRNARDNFTKEYDEERRRNMAKSGIDLVMTSSHSDSSERCAPFQGRVFSEFGRTPGYPKLQDAIDEGFRGHNCRHDIEPYIEGLTDEELFKANIVPEAERAKLYDARQHSNYCKRNADKYNTKMLIAKDAGNDKAELKYKRLKAEWNKRASQ